FNNEIGQKQFAFLRPLMGHSGFNVFKRSLIPFFYPFNTGGAVSRHHNHGIALLISTAFEEDGSLINNISRPLMRLPECEILPDSGMHNGIQSRKPLLVLKHLRGDEASVEPLFGVGFKTKK